MMYFFTALYCEACPLIQRYQLKKETGWTHVQVFSSETQKMCLVITGPGMIAAAAAVGSVCTKYLPNDGDFLINIGVCACLSKQRGVFLCSKITEQTTEKTFYPDLLYRHPFSEAQVITGAKPFEKENLKKSQETSLYDMEASAIYQSGSYFFGPHQMIFLKIISDDGSFENVTSKLVQSRIEAHMDSIVQFLDRLKIIQEAAQMPFVRNDNIKGTSAMPPAESCDAQNLMEAVSERNNEIQKMTEKLCEDLHCSHVMSASVRQLIRYCILSGIDYLAVIDEMYREGQLPCKDKREGKLRLEELGNRLL